MTNLNTEVLIDTKNWKERKQELKEEIAAYFSHQVDKKLLYEIFEIIRNAGKVEADGAFLRMPYIYDTDDEIITDTFAPRHIDKVLNWIHRYGELMLEDLRYMDDQRQHSKPQDFQSDDDYIDAQTDNHAEAQVYDTRIIVKSLRFKKGFAQLLPTKGKKPLGKAAFNGYEWEYPTSAIGEIKKLGIPVIFSASSGDN